VSGATRMHRLATRLLLIVAMSPAAAGAASDQDRLVFHAETASGETVASQLADLPFNPASVVKVATSLWALESLGPDHRYSSRRR